MASVILYQCQGGQVLSSRYTKKSHMDMRLLLYHLPDHYRGVRASAA